MITDRIIDLIMGVAYASVGSVCYILSLWKWHQGHSERIGLSPLACTYREWAVVWFGVVFLGTIIITYGGLGIR